MRRWVLAIGFAALASWGAWFGLSRWREHENHRAAARIEQLTSHAASSRARGDFSAAEDFLRQGLADYPGQAPLHFERGELALAQAQVPAARAAFAEATVADPQLAKAWTRLGYCDFLLGDEANAVVAFERALTVPQPDTVAVEYLATAAQRRGPIGGEKLLRELEPRVVPPIAAQLRARRQQLLESPDAGG